MAIDYTHAWQRQHWRTLFSAYGRAPFFRHFGPELEALIFAGYEYLPDLNLASIEWLRDSMRIQVGLTTTTVITGEATKIPSLTDSPRKAGFSAYGQVFEERFGFQPDLSAIDLLMNEGPYAAQYLDAPER